MQSETPRRRRDALGDRKICAPLYFSNGSFMLRVLWSSSMHAVIVLVPGTLLRLASDQPTKPPHAQPNEHSAVHQRAVKIRWGRFLNAKAVRDLHGLHLVVWIMVVSSSYALPSVLRSCSLRQSYTSVAGSSSYGTSNMSTWWSSFILDILRLKFSSAKVISCGAYCSPKNGAPFALQTPSANPANKRLPALHVNLLRKQQISLRSRHERNPNFCCILATLVHLRPKLQSSSLLTLLALLALLKLPTLATRYNVLCEDHQLCFLTPRGNLPPGMLISPLGL